MSLRLKVVIFVVVGGGGGGSGGGGCGHLVNFIFPNLAIYVFYLRGAKVP